MHNPAYAILALCLLTTSAHAQSDRITVAYMGGENSLAHAGAIRFAECFNMVSGGARKMELLDGQVVGNVKEMLSLTGNEQIAFSIISDGYQDLSNGFDVFNLPFLIGSQEELRALRANYLTPLSEAASQNGLALVDIWDNEAVGIVTQISVSSPEDFQGLKFRQPATAPYQELFEKIGVTPTQLPFSEVYESLATGVIDGMELSASRFDEMGFYEVAKHFAETNHRYVPTMLFSSPNFLSVLHQTERAIIESCAVEAGDYTFDLAAWQADETLINLTASGVTIYTPTIQEKAALKEAAAAIHASEDLSPSAGVIVGELVAAQNNEKPFPATRLPTRLFSGPRGFPPDGFPAYGIVAFPIRPEGENTTRAIMICGAYLSTFRHSEEALRRYTGSSRSDQMVTVWPVTTDSAATQLNQAPRRGLCDHAVSNYDFGGAKEAIEQGRLARGMSTKRGPFLLAWAPGADKGDPGAPVLTADLSNVETTEEAAEYFLRWHEDIEDDPRLWPGSWSVERFRQVGHEWFNRTGKVILSLVPGEGD